MYTTFSNLVSQVESHLQAIFEPLPTDRLRELTQSLPQDLQTASHSQRESQDSCEQIQVPRLSSEPHNP